LIPRSVSTPLLCRLASVRNGNGSGSGFNPCRGLLLLLLLLPFFLLLLLHTTLLRAGAAVEAPVVMVAGRGETPDSHRSPPRTAASLVFGVCVCACPVL
jgi:hypothetical protein